MNLQFAAGNRLMELFNTTGGIWYIPSMNFLFKIISLLFVVSLMILRTDNFYLFVFITFIHGTILDCNSIVLCYQLLKYSVLSYWFDHVILYLLMVLSPQYDAISLYNLLKCLNSIYFYIDAKRYGVDVTSYYCENFFDQFLTKQEYANKYGQIYAKQSSKRRKKALDNKKVANKRMKRTQCRRKRKFPELSEGAFSRCDHFKRKMFAESRVKINVFGLIITLFIDGLSTLMKIVFRPLKPLVELSFCDTHVYLSESKIDWEKIPYYLSGCQIYHMIQYIFNPIMSSRLYKLNPIIMIMKKAREWYDISTRNEELFLESIDGKWANLFRIYSRFNYLISCVVAVTLPFSSIADRITNLKMHLKSSSYKPDESIISLLSIAANIARGYELVDGSYNKRLKLVKDVGYIAESSMKYDFRYLYEFIRKLDPWIQKYMKFEDIEDLVQVIFTLLRPSTTAQAKGDTLAIYLCFKLGLKPGEIQVDTFIYSMMKTIYLVAFPTVVKLEGYESESLTEVYDQFKVYLKQLGGTDFCDKCCKVLKILSDMCPSVSPLFDFLSGIGKAKNISCIIVSLMDLLRSAYESGNMLESLFLGDKSHSYIDTKFSFLMEENFDPCGLHGMRYPLDIASDIEMLMTAIDRVRSDGLLSSYHKKNYNTMYFKLQNRYQELMNISTSYRRSAPFAIAFVGPPGAGKGVVRNLVFKLISSIRGWNYNEAMVYSKDRQEYYEGYLPATHKFGYFAEVATDHPDLLRKNGDVMLDAILPIVDGNHKLAEMAFSDKGKIPILFDTIICDSNDKSLGVISHKNCPQAFYRRFLRLQIEMKEEFCFPNTKTIDKQKFPRNELTTDCYKFKFEEFRNVEQKDMNKYRIELGYIDYLCDRELEDPGFIKREDGWIMDFESFSYVLSEAYGKHHRSENQLRNNLSSFMNAFDENFSKQIEHGKKYFSESDRYDMMADVLLVFLFCVMNYYGFIGNFTFCFVMFPLFGMFVYYFGSILFRLVDISLICYLLSLVTGDRISYGMYIIISRNIDYVSGTINDIKIMFKNVCDSLKSNMIQVILCILCVVLYSLHKIHKYKSESNRAEIEKVYECGKSYSRVSNKTLDIWNSIKNDYSPVYKGYDFNFRHTVHRNTRLCKTYNDTGSSTQHILGVCKNYAIINKHAIHNMKRLIVYNIDGTVDIDVDIPSPVDITHDLALIRLPKIQFRSILKHIPNKRYVFTNTTGYICDDMIDIKIVENVESRTHHNTVLIPYVYDYEWPNHKTGTCGNPIIAKVGNGLSIIGIHSMGKGNNGASIPIFLEDIESAISDYPSDDYRVEALDTDSSYLLEGLVEPHFRSPFCFERFQCLDYYGSTGENVLVHNKSKQKRLISSASVHNLFIKHFGVSRDVKYSKPMMQPTRINNEYISPINVALNKMNKPQVFKISKQLKHKAFVDMCNRSEPLISKIDGRLKPIDMDTAINGALNDPYIRRMAKSTGAGYGFPGKKIDYLVDNGDGTFSATPQLEERVLDIIDKLSKGESTYPVASASLKDETRPIDKCLSGKTRLFYGASIDQLIVARMFLQPFFSCIVEDENTFCAAVGINSHTDYDKLYSDLKSFSNLYMEGDYSGFDINMVADVRLLANIYIEWFCKQCGYNAEACKIVRNLLQDQMQVYIGIYTDIFSKYGLWSSGYAGTAEYNCLVHLFYFLIYFNSKDNIISSFDDVFLLKTYGDDMIAAVNPKFAKTFNNVDYQKFCKEYFSITFTSASKDENVKEFVSLEELTFLKRRFVYSPICERFVGKLDINSMFKMVEWFLPSSYQTDDEQAKSICDSFLTESVHYMSDIEKLDTLRSDLIVMFKDHGFEVTPRHIDDVVSSLL